MLARPTRNACHYRVRERPCCLARHECHARSYSPPSWSEHVPLIDAASTLMNEISKARFNALVSHVRDPLVSLLATELRWFEFADERLLAALVQDTDGEFSAVILARDLKERFRWVDMTAFFSRPEEALDDLVARASRLLPGLGLTRIQGDEQGRPVDFFTPLREDRLDPGFVRLATSEEYSPARQIIEPMMRWYEDADGNFVDQFQTTGFDARIWELYLFAALGEAGYSIDRSFSVPDFGVRGLGTNFYVEATTVQPTRDRVGNVVPAPTPASGDDQVQYMHEHLPIRFAGPLTTKLEKEYWELPHVEGTPLVFAIQDFHERMSMVWSRTGLSTYLFGYTHEATHDADGFLTVTPHRVERHEWGDKTIPSGFFRLPEAANVSAVMFNSSGTISKFNRIGVSAGFGSGRVRMVREGLAIDPDPNASVGRAFRHVIDWGYGETWMEGMDVFHNPNARFPLDPDVLPAAAHHRLLEDGSVESVARGFQPLTSTSSITIDRTEQQSR